MTLTCPTRNCRRTDVHDAKGCVVAWDPSIYGRPSSRGELLHRSALVSVSRDSLGRLASATVERVSARLMCDFVAGVIDTERP